MDSLAIYSIEGSRVAPVFRPNARRYSLPAHPIGWCTGIVVAVAGTKARYVKLVVEQVMDRVGDCAGQEQFFEIDGEKPRVQIRDLVTRHEQIAFYSVDERPRGECVGVVTKGTHRGSMPS